MQVSDKYTERSTYKADLQCTANRRICSGDFAKYDVLGIISALQVLKCPYHRGFTSDHRAVDMYAVNMCLMTRVLPCFARTQSTCTEAIRVAGLFTFYAPPGDDTARPRRRDTSSS